MLGLIAAVGCGPTSTVTLMPVEGRVMLDGEPVRGCVVAFEPVDAHSKTGPQAIGIADSDGRFRLRTSGNRLGAVVGVHRVFVVPGDEAAMAAPRGLEEQKSTASASPSPVPGRYQSAVTSGLEATVMAEGQNVFVFDLYSRPK
jgi:hypothetical protein